MWDKNGFVAYPSALHPEAIYFGDMEASPVFVGLGKGVRSRNTHHLGDQACLDQTLGKPADSPCDTHLQGQVCSHSGQMHTKDGHTFSHLSSSQHP